MVMQAWKLCFLNCFDPRLFGDLKATGWVSSGGAILLWPMKKTSKWRNKRKEVKLDKRLGLKSENCFLYFSSLYSKQVFDFFNLTLANFKQNEFSSSLVPFCLASLSFHTCWSLAEKNRPSHSAPPWIAALPAWVTAAVWPFGRLVIVHLSNAAQWGTTQVRQSTDAIRLFHCCLLVEMDLLLFSSVVSFPDLFLMNSSEVEFCSAGPGLSDFLGFLIFQSYSGSLLGCTSCLSASCRALLMSCPCMSSLLSPSCFPGSSSNQVLSGCNRIKSAVLPRGSEELETSPLCNNDCCF